MITKKDLIQDLTFLHEKTGLSNQELDETILILFNSKNSITKKELEKRRNMLYLEYTRVVVIKIEENLSKLQKSFGDIKSYNEKLSECFRELHNLDVSFQMNKKSSSVIFNALKKLFDKANKLDSKVLDNGDNIMTEGRIKFVKLYLLFLSLTTVVYGWIIKDYLSSYLLYVILGWLVVSILTGLILFLIARFFIFRPTKLK